MLTAENVFFMVAIPVALMGVIGLVLLSGRLKPETRLRMERAFIVVFYPILTLFFGWRTVQAVTEADGFPAALSAFLCPMLAAQGVRLLRKTPAADGTRT